MKYLIEGQEISDYAEENEKCCTITQTNPQILEEHYRAVSQCYIKCPHCGLDKVWIIEDEHGNEHVLTRLEAVMRGLNLR